MYTSIELLLALAEAVDLCSPNPGAVDQEDWANEVADWPVRRMTKEHEEFFNVHCEPTRFVWLDHSAKVVLLRCASDELDGFGQPIF